MDVPAPPATLTQDRRRLWTGVTLAILIVGYAGYYLCRSNLSVTRPLIMEAFPDVDKARIGLIASVGTFLYAAGKFTFGSAADVLGGRRMFLFGMLGAVLFTFMFGFGGPPLFLAAWCGNRFVQSAGWGGLVKVASRWFGTSNYGRAMGALSLSFLFGDFLSRRFLGMLIRAGWGWQNIFFLSGGVLLAIAIPTAILLRNSPGERNLPEPEAQAALVEGTETRPLKELILPLLRSRRFLTICILSFGFTFMRETFNEWTPTYLHEAAKMSKADAADASSYFPLFGGLSVLGVGFLADRVGARGRSLILAIGLLLGTVGLLGLGLLNPQGAMVVALVPAIAFVLIGPYSLLAGAISIDFGGKAASATAAGWIDGIGYLGGILSGYLIARIAESAGWSPAFLVLAGVSTVSGVIALIHARKER